jgi:hypothetical protein
MPTPQPKGRCYLVISSTSATWMGLPCVITRYAVVVRKVTAPPTQEECGDSQDIDGARKHANERDRHTSNPLDPVESGAERTPGTLVAYRVQRRILLHETCVTARAFHRCLASCTSMAKWRSTARCALRPHGKSWKFPITPSVPPCYGETRNRPAKWNTVP